MWLTGWVVEQERPYVMLRHGKNYTGNSRFYGFCIELLDEIARISSFSYIMEINPDGVYGVPNPTTGEWNGIVKQLMTHVITNQPTNQPTNHLSLFFFCTIRSTW